MRCFARVLLCLCLAWSLPAGAEEYHAITTVAVMPFVKLKGDKTLWLDKAVADLVALKLTESDHYAVLNRDALQTFLKETQLEQSGFMENAPAVGRIGKVARVDEVVYGNYDLDGTHITIHSQVMDVQSQAIRERKDVSGELNALIPLCGQLVNALLADKNIALSDKEKAGIAFTPTDSLPAMEHFYNGLYAYDQGDYEAAMGEFYAATRQDPSYLDAKLWFARMMEELGKDDEAVLAYLELYAKAPGSIEGIDARYFAARLQAKTNPEEAIKTYETLTDIRPEMPETLEAAFETAQLYRKKGDAEKSYVRFRQIDDFSTKVREHATAYRQKWSREKEAAAAPAQSMRSLLFEGAQEKRIEKQENADVRYIALNTRHSRFFEWNHALGLYRQAVTEMVELYRDLPVNAQGAASYPPPHGSFVVDPANPVIKGDVRQKDKSLFGGDHTYLPTWKETFYALIIPKGYEAVGAHLQITGRLPEPTPSRDFTLRVMPFPLPQSYKNTWLGVIFGQTPETATLSKEAPFFGHDQHLLAVQLIENYSVIDNWQVTLRLRKESGQSPPQVSASPDANAEGAFLAKVGLGPDSHNYESMPQYIQQSQPMQKLALAEDPGGSLWLVGVKGELYGQETDLWITHSEDGGKNWAQAQPMRVNSASLEFAPSLIRAEDGSLQLFFLSNRRGLGWELWASTQERKTKQWSHPALVPIRDFMPTGFETSNSWTDSILPYSAMQDSHGKWLVAASSFATHQMLMLASDDLVHWSKYNVLPQEGVASITLGQDSTDRYYMVTVDANGNSAVRTSNDAKSWEAAGETARKIHDPRFPVTLLKRKGEGMAMLFSDSVTGLQYAVIAPGKNLEPDLVTAGGLEPYAAAPAKDGVVAALWKDDDISIQRYHTFAFAENGRNNPQEIIYAERSRDKSNGVWDRIFARERYRVPDVTAVGTSPEGRAWWGIETGIMSLKGSDFFFSDVSQGFFSHYVDRIVYCGGMTWLASSDLRIPQVGYSTGRSPSAATVGKPLRLSELHGGIAAIACDGKDNTYFASSSGEILLYPKEAPRRRMLLPEENGTVTALGFDAGSDRLIAGSGSGALYAVDHAGTFTKLRHFAHAVDAAAADAEGHIWVAVAEEGVIVLDANARTIKSYGAPAMPANIKKLVPDSRAGMWAIADSYSPSSGLMHMDLHAVSLHNPPQKILRDIVDFDVADDGSIWIGTNLDGIYHYRAAQ